MAEIIFNLQYCKTEYAKNSNDNTFKQIDTADMLSYYERKEACDYTQSKYIDTTDAIDYYNYRIGSNGGFNNNGSLEAGSAKKIIEKYKPKNMYRMVFSFEEDFLQKNGYLSKANMEKLVTKSMNKNIQLMNLNPDNVVWGAYYHTNTAHPHVHIWLFEKQPTKDYLKIPRKTFKKMRSNMVRSMAINSEMYAVRDEVKKDIIKHLKEAGLDENLFIKSNKLDKKIFKRDKHLTKMLRDLEAVIPEKGSLKYNSKDIAPFKEQINEIIDYMLKQNNIDRYYKTYLKLLSKERDMYNNRYFTDEEKFKQNKFIENKQHELISKIGNMILQNIKNYRLDCKEYEDLKFRIDNDNEDSNTNIKYSSQISARHSMQSRSAILSAGVLDELSKAIDETVTSSHVIEYKLEQMIKKAQLEIRRNNSITL